MAEALYRKYRPQTFEDVVGQEHIERTLRNAIQTDKVSHAYLFTGPRGTGKTTTARLLAKALLCEGGPTPSPDGTCEDCQLIAAGEHPDVYELDAASRTGVENVREEIIGRVNYAPTRGRYKVYIIDEVHMLSVAAFNALLKTLEEPPAHVVFVLCTTDPQKVPETIQSRCQRFDFRRISSEELISRLGAICEMEGVEYEGDALDLIAHRAQGGMRDALTSLEQLITFSNGSVTALEAERLLGALDSSDLAEIVKAIGTRDVAACFRWTSEYVETGADLAQITKDLAAHIRDMYVMSLAGADVAIEVTEAGRRELEAELAWFGSDRLARLLAVLGDLISELKTSTNQRLSFEIALTRMVRPESDITLSSLAERVEALERNGVAAVGASVGGAGVGVAGIGAAGIGAAAASAPVTQPVQATQGVAQDAQSMRQVQGSQGSQAVQDAQQVQQPQGVNGAQVYGEAGGAQDIQDARQNAQNSQSVQEVQSAQAAQATTQAAQVEQQASSVQSQASQINQANQTSQTADNNSAVHSAASASAQSSNAVASLNGCDITQIWNSILANLKKQNEAYGVLFLNTFVSSQDGGNKLLIEFSSGNNFAFNAAKKAEAREALEKALSSVGLSGLAYEIAQSDKANVSATAKAVPTTQVASSTQVATAAQVTPVAQTEPTTQAAANVQAAQAAQNAQVASAPQTTQATSATQATSVAQPTSTAQPVSDVDAVSSSTPEVDIPAEPTASEISDNLASMFGDGVVFEEI